MLFLCVASTDTLLLLSLQTGALTNHFAGFQRNLGRLLVMPDYCPALNTKGTDLICSQYKIQSALVFICFHDKELIMSSEFLAGTVM